MNDFKVLPEIKMTLSYEDNFSLKVPRFTWASPEIGNRNKIGGCPDYIQQSEQPKCKSCNKDMIFYAQIDSINDDYMLADCGLIYLYICFDCFETCSFIQSF